MQVSGRPVTSFDPEGLIFAAGINSEIVKLYDLRSFDKVSFFKENITAYCDLYLSFRLGSIHKFQIGERSQRRRMD